jgi:hypothetical protein
MRREVLMSSPSLGSERPKSKRRWFQFSLSAIFVLTLAVAGFLSGYLVGEQRGYQSGLQRRLSERPVVRVYDVADLVSVVDPDEYPPTRNSSSLDAPKSKTTKGFGSYDPPERSAAKPPGSPFDFDSIISMITTTIEPATWSDVGAAGTIVPYERNLTLVINQYPFVHEEIEDLFQELREKKAARTADNLGKTSP